MMISKWRRLFGLLLMAVGFLIPSYCFGQRVWNDVNSYSNYEQFSKQTKAIDTEDRQTRSQQYNEQLQTNNQIVDPFVGKGYQRDYGVLEDNQAIFGYVIIPKIGLVEPIYLGANEANLLKGAAHVDGTPLPVAGDGIRSVIGGHRSGVVKEYFHNINQLQKGDAIYIDNGVELVQYRVTGREIIEPSEWEKLLPQKGKNMLTLMTCDPIPTYTDRLLINSERVKVTGNTAPQSKEYQALQKTLAVKKTTKVSYRQWANVGWLLFSLVGLFLVLIRMRVVVKKAM